MKIHIQWFIAFFRWLGPAPELDAKGGPGDNLATRLHLWWVYRP